MNQPLPIASAEQNRAALRRMFALHRAPLAALVGLHALAVAATAAGPVLFGGIVSAASGPTDFALVWLCFLGLVGALILRSVFVWLAQRASWRFGEQVFARLRSEVVEGVVRMPLRRIERAGSGEVVARTSTDIDAVSEGVRIGLPEVLVGAFSVLFTTAVSFVLDWRVAIAAVAGIPVLVISTRWYVRRSQAAYAEELAAHGRFDGAVLANVSAARTIDLLALGSSRKRVVRSAAGRVAAAERRTLDLQLRWIPTVQLGYYLPVALVALVGGWLALDGQVEVGIVIAIALNVQLVVDPLDDLIYWTDQLQLSWSALGRMTGVSRPVLDRGSDAPPRGRRDAERPSRGGRIELRDVTFGYDDAVPVVEGLSLEVEPMERVAIVGASGAGKSTVALLAAGLLEPDSGIVRLSGSARERSQGGAVMLVTQEPHDFTGSLRRDLTLVAPDADDIALRDALDTVGLSSLSEHLDDDVAALDEAETAIGPAWRQRVALARVVLADPEAVVLDESTSAMTALEAAVVERALDRTLAGRTVVVIAHRLTSVMGADRVVVLDRGRITEQGPPSALIGGDGPFATMWRASAMDLHREDGR